MRKALLIIGVAGMLAAFSLACGGSGSGETETSGTANTVANTETSSQSSQPAAPPTGDGFINISADGNRILFDTDTIMTTQARKSH